MRPGVPFFKTVSAAGRQLVQQGEQTMATQVKNVKYLVRTTNHGFKGRYWTEGEVVEFPPDVIPDKRYFERITKDTVLPVEADIDKPVNTLADSIARPYKKEPTAGQVLADQKVFTNGVGPSQKDIFEGGIHPAQVPLTAKDRKLLEESGNEL